MNLITALAGSILLAAIPTVGLSSAVQEGYEAALSSKPAPVAASSPQTPQVGTAHRIEVSPEGDVCYVNGTVTDCVTSYIITPAPQAPPAAPQTAPTTEISAPTEGTDETPQKKLGTAVRVVLNEDGTWSCYVNDELTSTVATPADC